MENRQETEGNKTTEVSANDKAAELPPELFIGLVGGVGTDFDVLVSNLTNALNSVGYDTLEIRLSSLIRDLPKYSTLPTRPLDEHIKSHMKAGDEFRAECERNDAVALLGVGKIKDLRESQEKVSQGQAYLIRSLKNPEEVKTLRTIYGDSFYLVAAYSPISERRMFLTKGIAQTRNKYPASEHEEVANNLIKTDQEELGAEHGQQSRDSIHRADAFVDMRDAQALERSVKRFIELLFGNTFHTPTKEEYGMFLAHAAALRSAELGRQVGAAITDREGEVLAVGCNEVPKAGGGLYWSYDKPDKREFHNKSDTSDEQKRNLISETLSFLRGAGWLKEEFAKQDDEMLLSLATGPDHPALPKDAKIRNVIEYGRAVHGEMAALTNAARKGVAVAGCTMFVTTFPCHLCARHIVSAGIAKVIYVEPYTKSLTEELYLDSISVDSECRDETRIPFEPFVGVAPRQYQNLFTAGIRKSKDGKTIKFSREVAKLRYHEIPNVYTEAEVIEFKALTKIMRAKGIIKQTEDSKHG